MKRILSFKKRQNKKKISKNGLIKNLKNGKLDLDKNFFKNKIKKVIKMT